MNEQFEARKIAYEELCRSYHRLKDFRAKLLGFLPLTSGAGIFLLLNSNIDKAYLVPIGLFGIAVTIGLYWYEKHGTKLLEKLFEDGRIFEEKLLVDDLPKGQFRARPKKGCASSTGAIIAARIIYGSVMVSWLIILLVGINNICSFFQFLYL